MSDTRIRAASGDACFAAVNGSVLRPSLHVLSDVMMCKSGFNRESQKNPEEAMPVP